MKKFPRKYLLPFLVGAFFLVLSTGCARRAHLSASIERFEYSPSREYVEVYIQVANDGERAIDSYEIDYRVAFDSLVQDGETRGLNLNPGESRTEYAITYVGRGKKVSDVSVTNVKW